MEEEMALAMKKGIRVKRGSLRGKVSAVFNVEGGRRRVVDWDDVPNCHPIFYRMGEDGIYDLEIIRFVKSCIDDKYHIEKKFPSDWSLNKQMADFMKPGLRVKPGSDWMRQDTTYGNGVGTVTGNNVDKHGDKWWSVHWDGKDKPNYNYRMGGKYPQYDLEIIGFFISTDNEFHVKVECSNTLEEEIEKYFRIGLRVQKAKDQRSGKINGNVQGTIVGTSTRGKFRWWKVKWDYEDSLNYQSYRMGDGIEDVKTVGVFKKTTENKFYYVQPADPK